MLIVLGYLSYHGMTLKLIEKYKTKRAIQHLQEEQTEINKLT